MREGVTIPNATARNKKLRVHVQHSRRFFQNALRQPNPAAQHRISLPGTTDQLEVIGTSRKHRTNLQHTSPVPWTSAALSGKATPHAQAEERILTSASAQ